MDVWSSAGPTEAGSAYIHGDDQGPGGGARLRRPVDITVMAAKVPAGDVVTMDTQLVRQFARGSPERYRSSLRRRGDTKFEQR